MNIFRIYFAILQFAILVGLVDGAVGFARTMREQAINAHAHDQINRSRFTRMMTDQKGVGGDLRKHGGQKR